MQDTIILYDIENSPMEMLAYAIAQAKARKSSSIRVLSDWTVCHNQQKWQNFFCSHEAIFIQIGRANTGKNSLDHALFEAALAMSEKEQKCFVTVTSDTDFAKLAKDLHRSADTYVIGIGCNKNDEMLKSVYDEFYQYGLVAESTKKTMKSVIALDASVSDRLRSVFRLLSDGEQWVSLGDLGNTLKKKYPKFKFPAQYPAKLKQIIELHHAQFEMKQIKETFYLREKHDALPVEIEEKLPKAEEAALNMYAHSDIEMRLRWKMALLMLHEGINLPLVEKITDVPSGEIEGLVHLLNKIKQ